MLWSYVGVKQAWALLPIEYCTFGHQGVAQVQMSTEHGRIHSVVDAHEGTSTTLVQGCGYFLHFLCLQLDA